MAIEFRKARLPEEMDELLAFDARVFGEYPDDLFGPEDWELYESYWMLADGVTVGCSAFLEGFDYDGRPRPGCLFIASTGILPGFQGKGLGRKLKEWQIGYARARGCAAIVTNSRESNERMIRLNESLGFTVRGLHPNYYRNPDEAAVVMEYRAEPAPANRA